VEDEGGGGTPRYVAEGAVVAPAWWWYLLPALTASLGFYLLSQRNPLGLAVQLTTATALGIIYVGRPRRKNPVRIVVDDRGIVLNNIVFAKLEDIVGLSVTGITQGGAQKRLTSITLRNGSTIELILDSDVHVAELRQAVGLALARSASRRFVGHSSLGCLGSLAASVTALVATVWAATVANFEGHLVLWGTIVPSLLIAVPLLFSRMKKVTVTCGEEGIHIKRVFGSRFVRYDQITAIDTSFGKIVTMRTGGGTAGGTIYNFELASSEDARAMLDDVRQRASMPKVEGDENLGAILARGTGQSIQAWMEAIRKQATPGDGYRSQHLSEDRLWAVLEDPSADPTARVAAAIALRTTVRGAAPQVRVQLDQRVRVAASSTAFPEVRGALEQIAEAESDEEIPARVMSVMK
jgi:hypothetical protein